MEKSDDVDVAYVVDYRFKMAATKPELKQL